MAEAEGESLESWLNKACNPQNPQEDWEFIMGFCDQVNKELEGPQIALRLLAHKIQSPQEKESLYALLTLEACVKNCGKRFHQEVGKFRFLNEIIKVVSPKYLGNHSTEKVKTRCVEMMYSFQIGLPNEPKIKEAYQMLKKQGLIKQDPTYIDRTFIPVPAPRPQDEGSIFVDEEKSKVLSRLLKSKHPEDLQAANRLIKNMVKQDADRIEKVSRRHHELDTVNNNVKLLTEMLLKYDVNSTAQSEKDIMKELYDHLDKEKPHLFRLASETEEQDSDGMSAILKTNDDMQKVMQQYKKLVEGQDVDSDLSDAKKSDDLLGGSTAQTVTSASSDLASIEIGSAGTAAPHTQQNGGDDDLAVLSDLFAAQPPAPSSAAGMMGGTSPLIPMTSAGSAIPVPGMGSHFASQPLAPTMASNQMMAAAPAPPPAYSMNPSALSGQSLLPGQSSSSSYTSVPPTHSVFSDASAPSVLTPSTTTTTGAAAATSSSSSTTLDAISELSKTLMQQSLPPDSLKKPIATVSPGNSLPMNKMITSSAGPVQATATAASTAVSQLPGSQLIMSPQRPVEVAPLSDVFVPLESITPGSTPALTIFDKDQVKVIFHFAKDRPRDDVLVIVVSAMSTHTSAIKGFSFQAAVPKTMRVKLQPPSATSLPAFNPILPPAAITQVLLLANPQKEKVRLKFKLAYSTDSGARSEVGEVDNLPLL